ncbi:glycosyltransferase family 39 protein [Patescibacteria group bacterium]|nr:glycosyltransferase family 39 protein [Patescibacteria group bacterium]MBP9709714.1 glycosyltransferase family 39 protein [Patescibacteria group bacterium]
MTPAFAPKTFLPKLFFTLIFTVTAGLGLLGLDYGRYGDEPRLLNAVSESVRTLLFLPRWYNYPSLSYTLVLLNATPQLFRIGQDAVHTKTFSPALLEELSKVPASDPSFLVRTRAIFFIVTWLGVVWVYLLLRTITGHEWTPALAAGTLASSWELQYHARLIAPDGLVFSFGALCLWLIASFLKRGKRGWIIGATIAAALACGAKYQGGIFLLPVLIASLHSSTQPTLRRQRIKTILSLVGIFCLAFLLTTPGALADTFKFISSILFEFRHYQTGHGNFTVAPGLSHAWLLLQYLASVVFSPFVFLALIPFLLAIFGFSSFIKTRPRLEASVFCLAPILFFTFMICQRALNVRNNILLFSFLTLFFGLGLLHLSQRFFREQRRWIPYTLVALLLIPNVGYQVVALHAIRHPEQTYEQAIRTLETRKEIIYLSSEAAAYLGREPRLAPLLSQDPTRATGYVFLDTEVTGRFPANHPRTYTVLAGSLESNMDYYPTFIPLRTKVVRMDRALAERLGIIPN